MVNLTALVKATITESSLSLSPSRCLPGTGNFPLIFARQFFYEILTACRCFAETAKPPRLPRARAAADTGVKAGTPGERYRGCGKQALPQENPAFARGGWGWGARGQGEGCLGLASPRQRAGRAVGDNPGSWRRWRNRGATLPSPSFMGKEEREIWAKRDGRRC